MEVRGLPPDHVLDQSTRRKIFFDEETDEPYLVSTDSRGMLRIPGTKPIPHLLRSQSPSFVDFIERCLDWDPMTRITPYEALLHDWIIEGLPPKVLLHHKRMLGLNDHDANSFRTSPPSSSISTSNNNNNPSLPIKRQASQGAARVKP